MDKCVAKSNGWANFNITAKPHGSSLRRFDDRYAQAYVSTPSEDRVWGTTFRVVRTVEVETDSLDTIVKSGQYDLPPPDVLTLDTEGTEFEILEGAGALLQEHIVCVVAEVAFLPVRQAQKLYGDVAALLSRCGFIPVQLQQHPREVSLYRAPVGLRGKGLQAFADAVFLKDPASTFPDRDASTAAVKLRKLAVAALAFGQLEYALDCLGRARAIGLPQLSAPPRYWIFLDALERCAARVEPRFLPVPGEIAPSAAPTASAHDATDRIAPAGLKERIKQYLVNRPELRSLTYRAIGRVRDQWRRIEYLARKHLGRRSLVERILAEYGFVALSDQVRNLRLLQTPWIASTPPRSRAGAPPAEVGCEQISDRSIT
jgi:FkbM family methyltransferase